MQFGRILLHLQRHRPMRMTPSIDTLFYGDNLTILRNEIEDESVDLVYLDPPFNSNANYNVLFKSPQGDNSRAESEFRDVRHLR